MSCIAWTPWARAGIDPRARADLEQRARNIGVVVSTGTLYPQSGRWTVKVTQGRRQVILRAEGDLAAIVAGALDDFECAA